MHALIIVDLQNDFIKGGSLEVPDAEKIIPLINTLVHYPFDLIIATKDWHPQDHISFAFNHNQPIGSTFQLGEYEQILWPIHCVQGSLGAEFAKGWDTTTIDKVFYKGTNSSIDSYSAFFDNQHKKTTGLSAYLKEKGVTQIFFAGLTTEYCVYFSVLDAIQEGFDVFVIVEACKGISPHPKETLKTLEKMQNAGASLVSFSEVESIVLNKAF